MIHFALRRIALIIPTLIIILGLSFALRDLAPGDEAIRLLELEGTFQGMSKTEYEQSYQRIARKFALNRPQFYFSILPNYFPDTLHLVLPKSKRFLLTNMLRQTRDWNAVQSFHSSLQRGIAELEKSTDHKDVYNELLKLETEKSLLDVRSRFQRIQQAFGKQSEYNSLLNRIGESIEGLNRAHQLVYPKFVWNGKDCKFHFWIARTFRTSENISLVDGVPVYTKVWRALKWTVVMSSIALLFIAILALVLGVTQAYFEGSAFDRFSSTFLYLLYAIPLFWLATMAVVFFTTPEYGTWTDIFPSIGLKPIFEKVSFWSELVRNLEQIVLPVICMTLGGISYLAVQLRSDILENLKKPFIVAARSKGLSEMKVLTRHALPNAFLPYLTILTGSIPAIFTGSVIIEVIFNIPGIGRLMLDSITYSDWPVVFSILVVISITTIIGYLIGDLLLMKLFPKSKGSFNLGQSTLSSQ